MDPDRVLIQYVDRALSSGAMRVAVPYALLSAASEAALLTARELCAVHGATMEIEC